MNKLEQKLTRIDLNLLIALSVLLKEKSVSKAADTLYVTQPAMSKTLNRLRNVFDDPLFHRHSSGLIPSPKALELSLKLPSILNQVDDLFKPKGFIPETCDQAFTISVPSVLCHAILLPFMLTINKVAPNICIVDLPSETDPYPSLEQGKYDFAIHVAKPKSKKIGYTSLGYLKPNIFAKKSHPLLKSKKTIVFEELKNYKFVDYQVGPDEQNGFESPADRISRLVNFKPDVVCKSSHLSLITALLENTDCLLIAPSVMINSTDFSKKFSSVYEFDIEKNHMLELLLLESPMTSNGEAEQWIKKQLLRSIHLD